VVDGNNLPRERPRAMMTTHTAALPFATSEWSEQELLQRMLRREGRAWREFHLRYDRLIYRTIHKVTQRFSGVLSSADVDEIYALLLCSLNARDMHKLRTFEPERGHRLSTWIGLLATNAAWDYLRSVARQPTRTSAVEAEELSCAAPDPFHALAAKEEWSRVHAMLSGFSEKDRTFVELFFLQGHTPEQIAEEMQISVKTVYSKKHKIRCRLESVLGRTVAAAA
jgi:RNA polymerase sigma-70 factor (ECF subfamily)